MPDSAIHFHFEDVQLNSFKEANTKAWITRSIETEKKQVGVLNYIFCSDQYLLKINQDYLNHNTFTDIVTFNYVEYNVISGDLFISIDRVKDNSVEFKSSFSQELNRVLIHGVLHLIGYNDKSTKEAQEIRAKEDFYLTLFADL
ncbi:MAG: putative rRNA maturation factor [Vicingaceae bacterium]|jgi:rRNA maturation RNase YbeY